jgi:hypothetical protein
VLVSTNRGWQPVGVRLRADHHEQAICGNSLVDLSQGVTQHEVLEHAVAPASDHLGLEADVDVGCRVHLADQVGRHPDIERRGSNQHRDPPGIGREVQGCLSGRVGAADDEDVTPGHGYRLGGGAAVEDAGAVECLQRGYAEPTVSDAHRQDDSACSHHAAVGQIDEQPCVVTPEVDHLLHERELGAQDPRLLVRLLGEAPTAHAPGETEVVADQGARRGLTADASLVDDQRPEPLRRPIDGGRQPGWSRADDHHVELAVLGCHGRP